MDRGLDRKMDIPDVADLVDSENYLALKKALPHITEQEDDATKEKEIKLLLDCLVKVEIRQHENDEMKKQSYFPYSVSLHYSSEAKAKIAIANMKKKMGISYAFMIMDMKNIGDREVIIHDEDDMILDDMDPCTRRGEICLYKATEYPDGALPEIVESWTTKEDVNAFKAAIELVENEPKFAVTCNYMWFPKKWGRGFLPTRILIAKIKEHICDIKEKAESEADLNQHILNMEAKRIKLSNTELKKN